jgi:hypothetical protein
VMEYAKERPIFQRCIASKPISSSPNQLIWWEINTIKNDA